VLSLFVVSCVVYTSPSCVDAYKRSFPEGFVVHLDTDRSRRPVAVSPDVPSIHDFVMEP
jgi:hypothetical protein